MKWKPLALLTGRGWVQPPDDLASLNSAISAAANGSTVTLQRRGYHLSGPIVVPPGKANLTIDLNGATLIWTAAGAGDNLYGIKVGMQSGNPLSLDAATPTKRTTLDDNLTVKYAVNAPSKGATTVVINDTVATAPAAGDIWIVYDRGQLIDVSSGPTTTAIRTWTIKVSAYNSGTKTITVDPSSGTCPHTFSGTVRVAKLSGVSTYGSCENITIKNGTIIGRALSNRARQRYIVHAQCVHGLTVQDVSFYGVQTGCVNAFACSNVLIERCKAYDMGLSGGGEGVAFWLHGCVKATVRDVYGRSLRHCVEVCDGSAQVTVTNGVCDLQHPSGAAWDTHGGYDEDVTFSNCRGGWIHFGNATYVNGGNNLVATGCMVDCVKLHGEVTRADILDCRLSQGVVALTYLNSGTHYAPKDVRIQRTSIGTWSDGGCIRFAGTGGGLPKAANILVEDCYVENSEASSTYCPGIDVTNWNTASGTLTVRRTTFHAPNRTDAKDAIRLWGDDTNMSIGALTLLVEDCNVLVRGSKLLNVRSSAGRVGSGTVTVRRSALYGACTAETTSGLASSWNSAAALSASGNGIVRW